MNKIEELTFKQADRFLEKFSFYKDPQEASKNKFWLIVRVDGNDFRHMFELLKSKNEKNPLLRIRTKNKGGNVSGKIVKRGSKIYLLHDPARVSNKTNRPEFTDPITFNGTTYSSFRINSNLVNKLAKYHLSRPEFYTANSPDVRENPSPGTSEDDKKRNQIWVKTLQRNGQARFREQLIQEYNAACLVTGNSAAIAIEAAHINPVEQN